jgi:hypothetical protein
VFTATINEVIVWLLWTSPSAEGVTATGYQVATYSNTLELLYHSIPTFLSYIYYVPLISIGGFGLYQLLVSDTEKSSLLYISPLLILSSLVFVPNPFWIVLEGVAEIPRWHLIAAPFFVISISIGFARVMKSGNVYRLTTRSAIVLLVSIFLLIGSVPSNGGLTDQAGFEKEQQRYISNNEMAMIEHIYLYPTNHIKSYTTIPLYISKNLPPERDSIETSLIRESQEFSNTTVLFSYKTLYENAIEIKSCRDISNSTVCSSTIKTEDNYSPEFTNGSVVYSNGPGKIYRF